MFWQNTYNMNNFLDPNQFMAMSLGGYSNPLGNMSQNGAQHIFQNIFGEPKHDAIAGAKAGETIVWGLGEYIKTKISDKLKINYKEEIHYNNKDINLYRNINAKLATQNLEYRNKISEENEIKKLTKESEDAWEKYKQNPTEDNQRFYNSCKSKLDEAKNANDAYNELIRKNNLEINENNKIIETLKNRNVEYKQGADQTTLEEDSGNIFTKATKKRVMNFDKKKDIATKIELNGAINHFRNEENLKDKKAFAQKVIEMYETNKEEFLLHYKDSYEIVKKWLKDN